MNKEKLYDLYVKQEKSVAKIALMFGCSQSSINYWLKKFQIEKRSISEAIYKKHNPNGDPYKTIEFPIHDLSFIFGLGLGLYWGEGTKSNKYSIRLGNTNPKIIIRFIEFLKTIYNINGSKLKFGLQLFNDSKPKESLAYWCNQLKIKPGQFQKIIISNVRGPGSYHKKSEHGVLTVYFNNKKLRDILCKSIDNL